MSDPTEPKSLADDVLGRLQNVVMASFDVLADQTVTIRAGLLHDAVAEIERLRAELGPDAATGCADDQTFAHLTPEQIRDTAEHMGILFPYGAPRPERWEVHWRAVRLDVPHQSEPMDENLQPFAVTPGDRGFALLWFRRRVPG